MEKTPPFSMEPASIKKYGWVPDLPDHRDFLFAKIAAPPPVMPAKVDLKKQCSPVEDQGQLGSCTANALAGALEFIELKNKQPFTDLSRLFIYYNERVIEHTVKSDSGAMLRDGIKTLAAQGVCAEDEWPYTIAKFTAKPSAKCYQDSVKHKIMTYHRLNIVDEMRSCLAEGYPFVFGFSVYDAFESQKVAQTGIVNMPKANEKCLGGHAVLCVGYDDKAKRFTVRNSWGPAWGKNGYFTIPYAYLASRDLADDFWTIRL